MRTIILCGVLFTTVCANVNAQPSEPAKDLTVRAEYTLKTPRTREPVLGGSKDKVAVTVWIPSGVKTVRGAVCNPFSKGEDVSKHWQAACRHWKFAYVQVDFDAVKKDEFGILKTGLNDLAKESQHPELAHVPLCFLGMSRGGGMSMQLTELMPERTIACAPVCLEVGPESDAARRVPAITIFGEKDGSQMEKLLTKLPAARKQNAQWAIAVQWNRKHEFGQANNLAFVFFDDVISRRVPGKFDAGKPVKLAELSPESGWLGDTDAWNKTGAIPTIAAWKDYKGDRDSACWFPSHRVAATWQAFVSGTKDVTIAEPAGLGDGQAFTLRPATKPITLKLTLAPSLKPTKVELWNGNERLAEKTEAPWAFDVTLKPGVHALHAVVSQKEIASRTSRPHTIVVGE
jgi:hypothetical protein